VVLVGDRQTGREHGKNLMLVPPETKAITSAIHAQLSHGVYAPSKLYGDGQASRYIVEHLKTFIPYSQKILQYEL